MATIEVVVSKLWDFTGKLPLYVTVLGEALLPRRVHSCWSSREASIGNKSQVWYIDSLLNDNGIIQLILRRG